MSAKKEKNVKEKKKISLTSMIFIALIAGAITGMVLHYLVPDSSVKNDVIVEGVLYVLGQGFIRLMKMLVVHLFSAHWYVEVWRSVTLRSWEM